jgi:hypothetical protein
MLALVVAARYWVAVVVFASLGHVTGARAQAVRVTHGDREVVSEGDFDDLPETVDALDNPERVELHESEQMPMGARIGLEIGAALGTTALLGATAFFVSQAHEESCLPEGCEIDPQFLAISIGAALATALVPLAILAAGNATGLEGNYPDTILGYVTGLVVAVLFASMGSGPGGDAFLYPALALGTVFPVAGALLAYEASTMPAVGSRPTAF